MRDVCLPILHTAGIVLKRDGVSRAAQDAFALTSQERTAAAQEFGRFDDEIFPSHSTKVRTDRATSAQERVLTPVENDEGTASGATSEGLIGCLQRSRDGSAPTPAGRCWESPSFVGFAGFVGFVGLGAATAEAVPAAGFRNLPGSATKPFTRNQARDLPRTQGSSP